MTNRPLLITVALCSTLASALALAHPGGHDDSYEKPIPTTCAHLADTQRYTDDVTYPEIKKLKEGCDVEKKKKPAAKPQAPNNSSDKH